MRIRGGGYAAPSYSVDICSGCGRFPQLVSSHDSLSTVLLFFLWPYQSIDRSIRLSASDTPAELSNVWRLCVNTLLASTFFRPLHLREREVFFLRRMYVAERSFFFAKHSLSSLGCRSGTFPPHSFRRKKKPKEMRSHTVLFLAKLGRRNITATDTATATVQLRLPTGGALYVEDSWPI